MKLGSIFPKLSTRQYISIFKGSLCYTLAFVLVFLRRFNSLNDYPVVFTSMILVTIAGKPGVSVGACLDGGVLGMAGVGVGAVFFVILAKLGHTQVGQGFVFFVMLYILALIKAQSLRYFAFSLLAIIMAFSGIYTSILLDGVFSPKYLEAYLEAYCWGFALVLGINLLIFPISSERELREFIVGSLERVSTFSHLIAKTYTLEISDEERAVRDQLNQSIRSDMAYLMQKLGEVGFEMNYTRWSLADYAQTTQKIRLMQQGLITSYSSLFAMERYDPEALQMIKTELMNTGTSKAFTKLRRGADLAFADIVKELATSKQVYHSPAPGSRSWEEFQDVETESDEATLDDEAKVAPPKPTRLRGLSRSYLSAIEVNVRLAAVSQRLRDEVAGAYLTPTPSNLDVKGTGEDEEKSVKSDYRDEGASASPGITAGLKTPRNAGETDKETLSPGKPLDRVAFLKDAWSSFEREQNYAVSKLLATSIAGEDELMLHTAGPSLHDQWNKPAPGLRGWVSALNPRHTHAHRRKNTASSAKSPEATFETPAESQDSETAAEVCSTTIMRVYSFIYGMGTTLEELSALHAIIVPKDGGPVRKKRLHFHFFESIPRPPKAEKNPMSFRDALREVSGDPHEKPRTSLWTRLARLEQLARTDISIYAFKTATAVSVFTVFVLAPSLKGFFVTYGLTGGLISIVVSMSPTMGQTFLTFMLQIMGTGFGAIFGMVILYIFKNVGGFYFNPYGLICLLALYSIPMCYIIYNKPMFFAGALLAMNGAGSLIITEWTYREIPGNIRPTFDSPGLRGAKALVAMSLALGIAGIFQVFILRTPARQTLRKKLSELTYSLAGYNILLSVFSESFYHKDRPAPSPESKAIIYTDLLRREQTIQMDLLALMPLLKFGAVEPAFGNPFKAGTIASIIRTHQIILDRLREARTAVGTDGFTPEIREVFIQPLSPYRLQSKRFSRALFYLCATSLATKSPLPRELPSMSGVARAVQHDAMVLSHRLTRNDQGRDLLASKSFVRYWFFLVSITSISFKLEEMETDLRTLFGELDILFQTRG